MSGFSLLIYIYIYIGARAQDHILGLGLYPSNLNSICILLRQFIWTNASSNMNTCILGQWIHSTIWCLFLLNHLSDSYQPLSNSFRPSSLTHSLQIHCIGLIRPRPRIIWARTSNRDPIIGAVCGKNLVLNENND